MWRWMKRMSTCAPKVKNKGVLFNLTKYTYQKTYLHCLKIIEFTTEAFISGIGKYMQFLISAYDACFGS